MEENFSPQQSLQLIQSMVEKTKANIADNGFYFLLWGWVAFFAFLSQYFLKVVLNYQQHYLAWLVAIPAVIFSIIYTRNKHRQSRVTTYIGESMRHLSTGVGIAFFILVFIISTQGGSAWLNAYPIFILLYGLGTFISGKIIRFTPLVIGGIFNWLLACAAAFVSYDYQLLICAVAIFTSYIIPGYLLVNRKN